MKNKLIELNMWYDNLGQTRGTLRFLIFFLMIVVVFVLTQPFQILSLMILLALRLYANHAQRNKKQGEKICRAVVKGGHQAQ